MTSPSLSSSPSLSPPSPSPISSHSHPHSHPHSHSHPHPHSHSHPHSHPQMAHSTSTTSTSTPTALLSELFDEELQFMKHLQTVKYAIMQPLRERIIFANPSDTASSAISAAPTDSKAMITQEQYTKLFPPTLETILALSQSMLVSFSEYIFDGEIDQIGNVFVAQFEALKTYIIYLQLLPENLDCYYDLKEAGGGLSAWLEELRPSLATIGVVRELDSLLALPSRTLPRYHAFLENLMAIHPNPSLFQDALTVINDIFGLLTVSPNMSEHVEEYKLEVVQSLLEGCINLVTPDRYLILSSHFYLVDYNQETKTLARLPQPTSRLFHLFSDALLISAPSGEAFAHLERFLPLQLFTLGPYLLQNFDNILVMSTFGYTYYVACSNKSERDMWIQSFTAAKESSTRHSSALKPFTSPLTSSESPTQNPSVDLFSSPFDSPSPRSPPVSPHGGAAAAAAGGGGLSTGRNSAPTERNAGGGGQPRSHQASPMKSRRTPGGEPLQNSASQGGWKDSRKSRLEPNKHNLLTASDQRKSGRAGERRRRKLSEIMNYEKRSTSDGEENPNPVPVPLPMGVRKKKDSISEIIRRTMVIGNCTHIVIEMQSRRTALDSPWVPLELNSIPFFIGINGAIIGRAITDQQNEKGKIVVQDDSLMSRIHAEIKFAPREKVFLIRDLGSSNGAVIVNGFVMSKGVRMDVKNKEIGSSNGKFSPWFRLAQGFVFQLGGCRFAVTAVSVSGITADPFAKTTQEDASFNDIGAAWPSLPKEQAKSDVKRRALRTEMTMRVRVRDPKINHIASVFAGRHEITKK